MSYLAIMQNGYLEEKNPHTVLHIIIVTLHSWKSAWNWKATAQGLNK